ncbi:hypothetical protein [Stappia sp. TSB10GB4]|uniref:hypothetical protein n=1 Tax=Stappia sp. TSB10GB4 TaxID=2003584 RepID=UPI001AD8A0AA|nr:hypothetical protein [Stappia sp. TSB10GB4]
MDDSNAKRYLLFVYRVGHRTPGVFPGACGKALTKQAVADTHCHRWPGGGLEDADKAEMAE